MPAFLAPAIPALLAKIGIGTAAKAVAGNAARGVATKALLSGGAKAAAGAAAKQGFLQSGKRMAGNALTNYLGGKPTAGALADRFGMDAAFGVMQGVNTPGDLGDKLIAGTMSAGGGALGGIASVTGVGKLMGKMPGDRMRGYLEMGGSVAGDMAGFSAGESIQRLKGGGTTPYEKQAMIADQQYRAQLEEEFRRQYGIGGYTQDPFLDGNGLS